MKNINKNIIALGWVSFFTDMASAMLVPIIPIFVVSVLDDGADKLGIILAVSSFISYFLRFFGGYLAEKYRVVKPLMVLGYAISAICKPLFFWSGGWQSVAALRATERLGKSIRTAPKDLLISHFSPDNKSGQNFGFHKMMDISGELFGTLIVFAVFYFVSSSEQMIRQLFLFTAIPGVIATLIMIVFVSDMSYPTDSDNQFKNENDSKLWDVNKPLWIPLAFFFAFTFFVFEESFFILRSKDIGFSLAIIPLLIVVSKLTQSLVSYKIGLLVDKHNQAKMMGFAYIFGIISLTLFISGVVWLTWLGFAFYGLYSVSTLNIIRSMISEKAANKGSVYGIFYAGMAISIAAGALFFGYVWEYVGGQVALNISLSGSVILFAGYLLYLRRLSDERR